MPTAIFPRLRDLARLALLLFIVSRTGITSAFANLTLPQRESHLWRAADILRGTIDAADYKHYIFGLLFFKRLSGVWEEEYEERLAKYGDADLAADRNEHRFHIPKGHFWSDVRKHTTNIGETTRGRRAASSIRRRWWCG